MAKIPSTRVEAGTFKHFRRLLGYVWPHKRYFIPALGCMLLMAAMYSVSIWSILPVLTVMVQPEGLHGWVDKYVAEKHLACEFNIYNSAQDYAVPGVPEWSAQLREMLPNSPLQKAGIKRGDFLLSVNDQEALRATDLFRLIQTTEPPLRFKVVTPDGHASVVPVTPEKADSKLLFLGNVVRLIPGGRTESERMRTLLVVLLLLMTVVFVGNISKMFAEYLAVIVNSRAVLDLRRQMYNHVLKLPLSRFSQNTSDTMSRFMQDMNDIFRGLENFFQKVLAEPFKAIGAVVLAMFLNWQLALVLLVCSPVAVVLFRKLGKRIRRANKQLLIGYGQMLGRLDSTLTGMRVVKGYMRENYERRQLLKIDRSVLKMQIRMGLIEAMTSPLVEMLGFLAGATAIYYFAYRMIEHKDMNTPAFMAMLACLAAIFDPLRKLSTVYPKLQRANAAAERIFNIIDSPSEYDEEASKHHLATFNDRIEFDNVTFVYPNSNRPAVRNFSMTVRKGEVVAIVGPNGSGKTTLCSLLPRFFPVNGGRILIDGHDANEVALRSLRRQFSLITQESIIFPDTVRENIAYARPDATEDQILNAARKAFADEFIQQMPEKYDTVVGEHGATLSGGQRQRIAIARAILRDAPILIFDEATSQVDPESELKIHQALEAFLKDHTALVIAHRFSTVSRADRIAVMNDGELVAVGTHQQLIKSCPLYVRLYETQFHETTDDEDEKAKPQEVGTA